MSSVTRLHLLSQSMLNVSCQKQTPRSSLPTDSLTESSMEFVGYPSSSGACNLLAVPGLSSLDVDDDDGEEVIGIRPKSSPLPRRRSSVNDEDSEPEPPVSGSRRVSFADAKGLNLVQVKEFDKWDVPMVPGYDSPEGRSRDEEEYFIGSLNFSLQLSTEELFAKVQEQKVELETIELLPGTTILKGVIRVLNISFTKAVYVRTTLDNWSSHFDLLTEYIPGSSDGMMDSFSFRLTLVPPFEELGTRVDFCLRYETPVGTFWGNNNNMNYVLFCHQKIKDQNEKLQKEIAQKKSCLKTVSQNADTVEIMSSVETSQQENVSTDVSKHGADVNTVKTNQTTDSPKGTSEENRLRLQAENRQNCSRRNRRKAARMARVRDYFAQRDVIANDSESNASLSGTTKTAEKESPVEKHSLSEVNIKSEDSLSVSESCLATCSKTTLDVQHDASKTNDYDSNNKAEKSEKISVADSATLTGWRSDRPDNPVPSNDELASAEHSHQNISKSVSKVEARSQKHGMSYECTNPPGEPHDSLVSQTNRYAFGTVVAPLYHQVFVRVESESQNLGDIRNPVWATMSNPHTKRRETSSAQSYQDNIQRNLFQTQEMNQECTDSSLYNNPHTEKEEDVSGITSGNWHSVETLQDPVEIRNSELSFTNTHPIKPNTAVHPQPENILNSDLLNTPQSLNLEGETQEDNLTHDLQEKTAKVQAQLPESACSRTCERNMDETLSHTATEVGVSSLDRPFLSPQPSQSVSVYVTDQQTSTSVAKSKKEHDFGETATRSTSHASSEEEILEASHDDSATKGNEQISVSSFETVKQKDVTRTESSLETQEESNNTGEETEVMNNSNEDEAKHSAKTEVVGERAESVTKAAASNCHIYSDMFVKLQDKDTLKDTEIIFPEKVEHDEMEAAVSKEDFNLADTTEVKNWEIMVEEEEKDLLTDEDESEALILETEDVEVVEDDRTEVVGERLEVSELEIPFEEMEDKTEILVEKDMEDLTAAEEMDDEAGDAVELEDNERREEEELEEVLKQLAETTVGGETEEKEQTEVVQEKQFAQKQETDIQAKDTREGEEEVNVTEQDETGVKWGDQVKPGEESVAREVEIKESERTEIEHKGDEEKCVEERLDNTQNKVEDHLSALVNNMQEDVDGRVIDKENTGEGQNAHMPPETNLYRREDFQSNDSITHDRSKAVRDEDESTYAERGSCILTDEPEIDQANDDGASSESGSDDEVELYMHCLRAVHGQHSFAQATKDQNKDKEFSVGKRFSGGRGKLLSTSLPSISESLDEEQHLSQLQDSHEDAETADFQPTAPALSASSGEENINRNTSWWKETFSCSNISKTLLYTTLLVLFLAVAYHYDFLACFGLYLISVVWLCCQGERQPVKNNNRIG